MVTNLSPEILLVLEYYNFLNSAEEIVVEIYHLEEFTSDVVKNLENRLHI